MKNTLKSIIKKYLENKTGEWIKKVDLYKVGDEHEFSPESTARCLRSLAEEGSIQVEYYKGKRKQKLAKYSALPITQKPLPTVKIVTQEDGRRIAVLS